MTWITPLAEGKGTLMGEATTVGLEGRLESPRATTPDPVFEQFYSELVALDATDHKAVLGFLKQYQGEDGATAYRTAKQQVTALQQALARMKAQGLESSPTYEAVRQAFAASFAANAFTQQFMQEVFNPQPEDGIDTEW
ncbi:MULTISPECIES: hypothetical protein [Pseudomonas]|uniref:Uncharacterized protein n=1 Tax=Pseudomonas quercus TaxID=2722792 RepID=A0ABX0Y8C4_9PSED|nr:MULTISPECIES: hypothetical protein [Pseudomonas]MBF7141028.1 hypothetical protein [Pseudomonas sp. LY10J]NJO99562.1 hypothetical protein [Pseudomonas quercus]